MFAVLHPMLRDDVMCDLVNIQLHTDRVSDGVLSIDCRNGSYVVLRDRETVATFAKRDDAEFFVRAPRYINKLVDLSIELKGERDCLLDMGLSA